MDKGLEMKELFRTRFLNDGSKRPSAESERCIEMAYRLVMEGYQASIGDLSRWCNLTYYKNYNTIVDFINGNRKGL
jgi:hypothetical protein